MIRTPFLYFLLLITAVLSQGLAESKKGHSHSILADIKTPQQLLFPHIPPKYIVALQLSGNIAEEMSAAVTRLGLEKPHYLESFDGENFFVRLANENYPQKTRDLLTGILNPAEIIDMSTESVLRYKSETFISELQKNSNISVNLSHYNQKPVWKISLTPIDKHFGYSHEDMGAAIRENWFEKLELVVDTALKVIYTIDALQIERIYSSIEQDAPEVIKRTIKYDFGYQNFNSSPLPSGFKVTMNGKPLLSISADYQEHENYALFRKKEVCSFRSKGKKCLIMSYGDYSFSVPKSIRRNERGGTISARDLSKAANLSVKATELMRKGNISAAKRVINTLVERYPETPQAIEAKEILMSLPAAVH